MIVPVLKTMVVIAVVAAIALAAFWHSITKNGQNPFQ